MERIYHFLNKSQSKSDLSHIDSPGRHPKQKDSQFDQLMSEIANFEVDINRAIVFENCEHKVKRFHDKRHLKKAKKSNSVEPSVENNFNKFDRESTKDNESVNNNYIIKEESSVYTVESRSRNNTKLPIINNRSQHYQPIDQLKQNDMRSYCFRKNVTVNSNRSGSLRNLKTVDDAQQSSSTNVESQK